MKAGYKTTEFWLTLITTVLSAILPAVQDMPALYKGIGLLISLLATLGYTAARTSIKNNEL